MSERDMVIGEMRRKDGDVGMKGNEITDADMKRWKKDGQIPVACRLCGEVVLYPSKFFKKDELANYECANCKMWLKLCDRR